MQVVGEADRYDAFISYSHAADGRLAPQLQRGLQRLAKRVFQRRALRVFRDETGLSANPHLWASIEGALLTSEWFVLLASPESAASAWVAREVETWLAHRPVDRLLIVVTDGELAFTPDGIDAAATTCLPTTLAAVLTEEPRWLDLRWCRHDEQLDLRNGRFRAAVADLAAPMHGVAKEDLESEDVRQQRRTRRLATIGVGLIAILTVLSIVAAVVAVGQRNTADEQRLSAEAERARAEEERVRADAAATRATARALAAQAVAAAPTDVARALLLGVEGYRLDPSLDTQTGLLTALDGARTIRRFVSGLPPGVVDVEVSSDGSMMWYATTDGEVWRIDTSTWRVDERPLVTGVEGMWSISLDRDAELLAVGGSSGVDVHDAATGEVLTADLFDVTPGSFEFDPEGERAAVSEVDAPGLSILDVRTGDEVAFVPDVETGVFLDDRRIAATALGSTAVAVYDLEGDPTRPVAEREDLPSGTGLSLSPDRSILVAGGLDGDAQLLDASSLEPIGALLQIRGSRISDVAFNGDGSLIAVGSDDGSVNVHETGAGSLVSQLTGLTGTLLTEFLGPTRLVAASLFDSSTVEFDIDERTQLGTTTVIGPAIVALAAVEDGTSLVTLQEGELVVSGADDPLSSTSSRTIGEIGRAMDVVETADGALLAATYGLEIDEDAEAVSSRTVAVWKLPEMDDVLTVEFGEVAVEQMALSPDGSLLAVGQRDGALTVIDVGTGDRVVDAMPVDELPCCLGLVVWSPSGDRVYTGGQDGTLRIWDAQDWSLVTEQVLSPDLSALRLGRFSDDGTVLVVPSESGAVYFVDPATGAPIGEPFTAAGTQLQNATLTRADTVLASVSRDGSLRLWDVATRRSLGPALRAHTEFSLALDALTPTRLATGGAVDGSLIEWTVDPDDWVDRACEVAGRNLTRSEWDVYVGGDYRSTCAQWPAES